MTSKTPRTPPPSDPSPVHSAHPEGGAHAHRRRSYAPPRLEVLGDIRDLTLGATLGVGDSTPPNTQPF